MSQSRTVRLLSGFVAGYLNAAVTTACSLVAVPLYVRYLGKEEYGLWLVVLSLLGPLALTGLGFPTATQNMLGEAKARGDWDEVNRVLTTGLVLLAVSTTLGSGLLLIVSKTRILEALLKCSIHLRSTGSIVVVISACGYLLAQPLQVFRLSFRAFEMVDAEQHCQSGVAVVNLLALVLVLRWGGGLLAVALLFASMQFFSGQFYALYLAKRFPAVCLSLRLFSKEQAFSMITPGFHFFVLSLSGVLIWGLDNLVIAGVLGVAFVTAFAIATRLISVPRGIFSVICMTVAPTITALNAQERMAALQRLVLVVTKLSLSAALIFGAELTFFGRNFIALWAGRTVVLDRSTFMVLVLVLVFTTLCSLPYAVLIATSKHKVYAYLAVAEGGLNLGLSYWWVHRWGVLGVALGTLVAFAVVSGWYLPFAGMRLVGVKLSKLVPACVLPALPAGTISVALGLLLRAHSSTWPGFVASASITFAGFGLFYVLFALGPDEKELLRRVSNSLVYDVVAS